MILQALPDARKRGPHLDPQVPQMRRRADPGAHQMRRGMNGAAGQDDLLAAELLRPASDDRLHADAALTLKDQLGCLVSVEIVRFSRIRVPGSR